MVDEKATVRIAALASAEHLNRYKILEVFCAEARGDSELEFGALKMAAADGWSYTLADSDLRHVWCRQVDPQESQSVSREVLLLVPVCWRVKER